MIKKNFRTGDVIVRENTLGNSAFIIEQGKVEVSKNIGRQRVVFTTLERGSIFGEMSLVDNSPRSATVTAVSDTTVTVLSKSNFQKMLSQNQPLQAIFGVLADRLRETDLKVNPLKLTNFYFSLSSLICHLVRSRGRTDEKEWSIDLQYLLDEACTILAVDREMVEKVVNRMAFTKLVRIDGRHEEGPQARRLVIPDEQKFHEFVSFLKWHSATDEDRRHVEPAERTEETFHVLAVLRENMADFDPQRGKTSVNYDDYLKTVEDMLNIGRENTDKLLRPYFEAGLFRYTVDPDSNIRRMSCSDPEKLDLELTRQRNLMSYHKMVDLLKALASN